jgi:hypothetical protein
MLARILVVPSGSVEVTSLPGIYVSTQIPTRVETTVPVPNMLKSLLFLELELEEEDLFLLGLGLYRLVECLGYLLRLLMVNLLHR